MIRAMPKENVFLKTYLLIVKKRPLPKNQDLPFHGKLSAVDSIKSSTVGVGSCNKLLNSNEFNIFGNRDKILTAMSLTFSAIKIEI